MAQENPIVIEDREELIFMLSEASALEHMVMCSYLFAMFSMKRSESEGITAEQLEAVRRWERVIAEVAGQEMLHLTLVCNLLTAIGAPPFFSHPNFPQQSGYYPPGVQFALLPFGDDALQHFLYLERPEGMDIVDAHEFNVLAMPRPAISLNDEQIVPQSQDFATVGHLYRGIEQGFRYLVDKYGEQRVFVGPPRAQATQKYFSWPELVPVTDLASAIQAIETIVEQGEGARGDWQHSHYGKFLGVAREYRKLKEQDPSFEPARQTVPGFVQPPSDTKDFTLITEPLAAGVSELFNASYEILLRLLGRYFVHGNESEEELGILSDVAVDAMFLLIKPLGELLTVLPVSADMPGKVAGPSFEIYRTGYLLPHRYAAWTVLHERLLELAAYSGKLAENEVVAETLAGVSANARKLADTLAGPLGRMGV